MTEEVIAYFAQGDLSRTWFDIVDPINLLRLPTQNIGKPERLADRKAVKQLFETSIRVIGKDSSVHASTISEVAVYEKTEDARLDSHPENLEDEHTASFIDNKISYFLGAVKVLPPKKEAQ